MVRTLYLYVCCSACFVLASQINGIAFFIFFGRCSPLFPITLIAHSQYHKCHCFYFLAHYYDGDIFIGYIFYLFVVNSVCIMVIIAESSLSL